MITRKCDRCGKDLKGQDVSIIREGGEGDIELCKNCKEDFDNFMDGGEAMFDFR